MSIIKEFKEFAVKGNMIDLAVGVVIGGAFGKIVTSLVNDIIMPPLNLLTARSGVHFKELALKSKFNMPQLDKAGLPIVDNGVMKIENKDVAYFNYGSFLQNIVDFLIIAIAVFVFVKIINSMKKRLAAAPANPATTPEDILLLREIRDALAKSTPRRID